MKVNVIEYDKQQCKECNCDGDIAGIPLSFSVSSREYWVNTEIRRRLK